MSDKGSRLHMKSKKQKCTLRLSLDEIEQIESYPGNNFTEKARSLLAAHAINMDLLDGNDLTEKYETILKGYLSCLDPELLEDVIRQIKCGLIPQIKNDFLRYAEAL